ncbi:MAG: hypothetical protein J1E56_07125, partial [Ruminococcus sp.]|nr:hypothetical protein [Ruminococcus sp.]
TQSHYGLSSSLFNFQGPKFVNIPQFGTVIIVSFYSDFLLCSCAEHLLLYEKWIKKSTPFFKKF